VTKRVAFSQEIEASPETIWRVLADATRLPDWAFTEGRFPYPVEGKYGSDQTEGVGAIWIGVAADGQIATQEVTTWQPASTLTLELQETANAPLQMAQTNNFSLEPVDDNTRVTWTVDWELTGGFSISSLLLRFTANGAFEEMIAGSLENLKVLVENEAVVANGSSTKQAENETTQPENESQTV
jgi:uncharacterized protein YndB with AHSA1/START domain